MLSIYFPMDVRTLSDEQKKEIVKKISLFNKCKSIELNGYADYVGDENYNIKLSYDRAMSVKEELIKNGIAKEIHIYAKGEQLKPEEYNDSIGVPEDRRVDIICVNKPDTVKVKDKIVNAVDLKDIDIDSLSVGDRIIVSSLHFHGGRHFLLPQSVPVLDTLYEILLNNPALKIEIQGHICCDVGSNDGLDYDTGDNKLSVNRAKYVYDQMVKRGIDPSRMQYKGFGRSMPIVEHEKTEADRIKNRRVEIIILDK